MILRAGKVGAAGGARWAGQQGGAAGRGKPRPYRRLLLPAAAEGTVELNETLVFGTASTCESELSGEE